MTVMKMMMMVTTMKNSVNSFKCLMVMVISSSETPQLT